MRVTAPLRTAELLMTDAGVKRLIKTCALILILVLFCAPWTTPAQSQERDKGLSPRVGALEKKIHDDSKTLAELNSVVKSLDQRSSHDFELFKEINNATIRAHEKTLSTITIVGSFVSLCITVIGLALGILGFKEFNRLKETANKAKQISEKAQESAQSITETWNTLKTEREAVGRQADRVTIDIRALEAVTRAMTRIWESDMADDPKRKKQKAHEALVELEIAEQLAGEPSAALLLEKGKAYKRLSQLDKAFQVVQQASELAKKNKDRFSEARSYYNGACYLMLTGEKHKQEVLKLLQSALAVSGSYRVFAGQDPDLKLLWEDEAFKLLIA